jgi:microcystin-dependent protein
MAYTPTIWKEGRMTTQQKVDALNHMETQYTQGTSYLGTITHSERYYTKTQMDAKYFSAATDGPGSGLVCETIDGQTAADILNAAVDSGLICFYESATPPAGWYLCNGQNGTPNLLDKFIIGAGITYSPGDTGGSNTTTVTGTVTVTDHALTVDEMPEHYHVVNDYYGTTLVACNVYVVSMYLLIYATLTSREQTTSSVGSGVVHTHYSSFAGDIQEKRPPFHALAPIMRG